MGTLDIPATIYLGRLILFVRECFGGLSRSSALSWDSSDQSRALRRSIIETLRQELGNSSSSLYPSIPGLGINWLPSPFHRTLSTSAWRNSWAPGSLAELWLWIVMRFGCLYFFISFQSFIFLNVRTLSLAIEFRVLSRKFGW
jgi:hypothetical protein